MPLFGYGAMRLYGRSLNIN